MPQPRFEPTAAIGLHAPTPRAERRGGIIPAIPVPTPVAEHALVAFPARAELGGHVWGEANEGVSELQVGLAGAEPDGARGVGPVTRFGSWLCGSSETRGTLGTHVAVLLAPLFKKTHTEKTGNS